MKKNILLILMILMTSQVQAGTWHYVQNGLSKHFGSAQILTGERIEKNTYFVNDRKVTEVTRVPVYEDYKFNEQNVGAGLEYDEVSKRRVTNYYGGYYLDSERNDAYYFGAGYGYRFKPVGAMNIDLGGLGIMLSRQRINNGVPFPAILPYMSIGAGDVALNLSFIPEIKDIAVPTLFVQFKVKLGRTERPKY